MKRATAAILIVAAMIFNSEVLSIILLTFGAGYVVLKLLEQMERY